MGFMCALAQTYIRVVLCKFLSGKENNGRMNVLIFVIIISAACRLVLVRESLASWSLCSTAELIGNSKSGDDEKVSSEID